MISGQTCLPLNEGERFRDMVIVEGRMCAIKFMLELLCNTRILSDEMLENFSFFSLVVFIMKKFVIGIAVVLEGCKTDPAQDVGANSSVENRKRIKQTGGGHGGPRRKDDMEGKPSALTLGAQPSGGGGGFVAVSAPRAPQNTGEVIGEYHLMLDAIVDEIVNLRVTSTGDAKQLATKQSTFGSKLKEMWSDRSWALESARALAKDKSERETAFAAIDSQFKKSIASVFEQAPCAVVFALNSSDASTKEILSKGGISSVDKFTTGLCDAVKSNIGDDVEMNKALKKAMNARRISAGYLYESDREAVLARVTNEQTESADDDTGPVSGTVKIGDTDVSDIVSQIREFHLTRDVDLIGARNRFEQLIHKIREIQQEQSEIPGVDELSIRKQVMMLLRDIDIMAPCAVVLVRKAGDRELREYIKTGPIDDELCEAIFAMSPSDRMKLVEVRRTLNGVYARYMKRKPERFRRKIHYILAEYGVAEADIEKQVAITMAIGSVALSAEAGQYANDEVQKVVVLLEKLPSTATGKFKALAQEISDERARILKDNPKLQPRLKARIDGAIATAFAALRPCHQVEMKPVSAELFPVHDFAKTLCSGLNPMPAGVALKKKIRELWPSWYSVGTFGADVEGIVTRELRASGISENEIEKIIEFGKAWRRKDAVIAGDFINYELRPEVDAILTSIEKLGLWATTGAEFAGKRSQLASKVTPLGHLLDSRKAARADIITRIKADFAEWLNLHPCTLHAAGDLIATELKDTAMETICVAVITAYTRGADPVVTALFTPGGVRDLALRQKVLVEIMRSGFRIDYTMPAVVEALRRSGVKDIELDRAMFDDVVSRGPGNARGLDNVLERLIYVTEAFFADERLQTASSKWRVSWNAFILQWVLDNRQFIWSGFAGVDGARKNDFRAALNRIHDPQIAMISKLLEDAVMNNLAPFTGGNVLTDANINTLMNPIRAADADVERNHAGNAEVREKLNTIVREFLTNRGVVNALEHPGRFLGPVSANVDQANRDYLTLIKAAKPYARQLKHYLGDGAYTGLVRDFLADANPRINEGNALLNGLRAEFVRLVATAGAGADEQTRARTELIQVAKTFGQENVRQKIIRNKTAFNPANGAFLTQLGIN